jgi:hypothetical protein
MNAATDTISTLRTQLAARRMVRQRNKRLEAELASYNTPAQRQELEAILGRHTPEEAAQVEAILSRQATVRPSHL